MTGMPPWRFVGLTIGVALLPELEFAVERFAVDAAFVDVDRAVDEFREFSLVDFVQRVFSARRGRPRRRMRQGGPSRRHQQPPASVLVCSGLILLCLLWEWDVRRPCAFCPPALSHARAIREETEPLRAPRRRGVSRRSHKLCLLLQLTGRGSCSDAALKRSNAHLPPDVPRRATPCHLCVYYPARTSPKHKFWKHPRPLLNDGV